MTNEQTASEAMETIVAELERRRKTEPQSFYSRPGRGPGHNGQGYIEFEHLQGRLRGWLNRLEALR